MLGREEGYIQGMAGKTDHWTDLGVDGSIVLEWILKWDGKA
jgi:hypothetical protein